MMLVAKITDEKLFQKWTHERGTVLYKVDEQGVIEKVVCHSGTLVVVCCSGDDDDNNSGYPQKLSILF